MIEFPKSLKSIWTFSNWKRNWRNSIIFGARNFFVTFVLLYDYFLIALLRMYVRTWCELCRWGQIWKLGLGVRRFVVGIPWCSGILPLWTFFSFSLSLSLPLPPPLSPLPLSSLSPGSRLLHRARLERTLATDGTTRNLPFTVVKNRRGGFLIE